MTTDYKNLTFFEGAAVVMIAVGVALVSFLVISALPDGTRAKLASSAQVFEMGDAAAEVWQVQTAVTDFASGSMQDFYQQFYVATAQVASPIAQDAGHKVHQFAEVGRALAAISDSLASNYQNNYVASGVEDGMGGRVMGAYIEKLSQ